MFQEDNMEILYLRNGVLGTGFAHRNIDTGNVVPPNGYRLCAIQVLTGHGSMLCAVKKGDTDFTYTTQDGCEAVATNKITKCTEKAAKLTGWDKGYEIFKELEQKIKRGRHR